MLSTRNSFPNLTLAILVLMGSSLSVVVARQPVSTSRDSARRLEIPKEQESFSFVIFGDATHSASDSLDVLRQAVKEVNIICPDFVINVGDMIDGYNEREAWLSQMNDYRVIMDGLRVPWFPAAGNHDVYWQGENRPEREHEEDFETHFGPLWYCFEYKKCSFIVLFTDEGDPNTGVKGFSSPAAQQMSPEQMAWLKDTLKKASCARHVFIFVHHPRWRGGEYGRDWERIHTILKKAGNVSAVFGGHTHRMEYDSKRDGIEYFVLGTTGGAISKEDQDMGYFHHYDIVTVRGDSFHIARLPVGLIMDPKQGLTKTVTIMPKQHWQIKSTRRRTLRYKIDVLDFPSAKGLLKIGIGHAADDSGDKGLYYAVLSSSGQVLQKEFIKSSSIDWGTMEVQPNSHFVLLLQDDDTSFEGKYPGNGGSLEMHLRYKVNAEYAEKRAEHQRADVEAKTDED